MKIFILSDIHGSASLLERALGLFQASGARHLILLGDVMYHGARNPLPEGYDPKRVAEMLGGIADRIIAVRGNCDSEVDQMVLNFPITADYSSLLLGGRRVFITHGHLFSETSLPPLAAGDAFLFGHTHIPRAEKQNGVYLLNPGSISMPKENTPRCCALLDESGFTVTDLDGHVYKEIGF